MRQVEYPWSFTSDLPCLAYSTRTICSNTHPHKYIPKLLNENSSLHKHHVPASDCTLQNILQIFCINFHQRSSIEIRYLKAPCLLVRTPFDLKFLPFSMIPVNEKSQRYSGYEAKSGINAAVECRTKQCHNALAIDFPPENQEKSVSVWWLFEAYCEEGATSL